MTAVVTAVWTAVTAVTVMSSDREHTSSIEAELTFSGNRSWNKEKILRFSSIENDPKPFAAAARASFGTQEGEWSYRTNESRQLRVSQAVYNQHKTIKNFSSYRTNVPYWQKKKKTNSVAPRSRA